jgi:hypothetical protein
MHLLRLKIHRGLCISEGETSTSYQIDSIPYFGFHRLVCSLRTRAREKAIMAVMAVSRILLLLVRSRALTYVAVVTPFMPVVPWLTSITAL